MNMTATCECEHGYAAEALVDTAGKRSARCLKPTLAIPSAFYNRRALPRDQALPVGRVLGVPAPESASDAEDPLPEGNMTAMNASKGSVSCALGTRRQDNRHAWSWLGGVFALGLVCRRLARRRPMQGTTALPS